MMILLPLHCERGTGYHTYRLSWELAWACGIFLGVYLQSQGKGLFGAEILIAVAGLFAVSGIHVPLFQETLSETLKL